MVVADIVEMVTKKVGLDREAQEQQILKSVAAIRSQAAAVGMLGSSRTVLQIEEVYVEAVGARLHSVWAIIQRCLDAGGIEYTPTLADELKALVRSYVPEKPTDSDWHADQEAVRLGLVNMQLYSRENLPRAYRAAHGHVEIEIDQYVMALKKGPQMNHNAGQILNIHGSTIGNLQTGTGATATVSQTVVGADQHALILALKELQAELQTSHGLSAHIKAESLDLIEDSVKEAEKTAPNKMKLGALVRGIGGAFDGTVSYAGKIPAAVEAVKAAAAALGLG